MGACFVGAMEAREEEAPDPRELRDALDTVASVVRLRAAILFARWSRPANDNLAGGPHDNLVRVLLRSF